MMTKAEELKALAKIKKILDEAGENSYIGMAFAGCVQMAESNIENDFGENPQERIESLENKLAEAKDEAKNYKEAYEALKKRHIAEVSEMQSEIDTLKHDKEEAINGMINERKDVTIVTNDGEQDVRPFERVQYINHEGFRFFNVIEHSGWTTSYKIDDIKSLTIA